MAMQCQYYCNERILRREAPLQCNAGQCEIELHLTLFHKSYIGCVKQFHK